MISKARERRLQRDDRRYLWHPFTQQREWEKTPPLIIERGQGVYVQDTSGKRFLDGVSSIWVNLHGHRQPVLDRALRTQLGRIAHSTLLGISNVPAIELAKQLIHIAPRGLTRVFYSDNGSTAIEVALKMAFQYWQLKGGGFQKKNEVSASRTGLSRRHARLGQRRRYLSLSRAVQAAPVSDV